MNNNKNLPRPTDEVIKEYDEVNSELAGLDPSWDVDEANAAIHKWLTLEDSYDWSNIEFTDPLTGKKGLKSVMDELVVPALYDSFPSPGTRIDPWDPIIAVLDGKYGMLDGKGGAEVIAPFEYDEIFYDNNWGGYIGRKANHEEAIKFIDDIDNPVCIPDDFPF